MPRPTRRASGHCWTRPPTPTTAWSRRRDAALDADGAKLADLEREHGPLPETMRTVTANGEHVVLRWPENVPRPGGDALFGITAKWWDKGYIIGPGSVHVTGTPYRSNQVDIIATLPDAWAQAASPAPNEGTTTITSGGYVLPERIEDGARYFAVRDFTAHLYHKNIARDERWKIVRAVLPPRFATPKPEAELRGDWERADDEAMPGNLGAPQPDRAEPQPYPIPRTAAAPPSPTWARRSTWPTSSDRGASWCWPPRKAAASPTRWTASSPSAWPRQPAASPAPGR